MLCLSTGLHERGWWKINTRQRRFADEYIISGNAYQSAIKAGYTKAYAKNAQEKLVEKGGKVTDYIKARMEQLEKPKIATANEVLEKFTAILRQETTEEVTELNPITGDFVTIEKTPSISEVIKAGSELMKRYPDAKTAEKLSLEIEKLKQQTQGSDEQDDKISTYIDKLKDAIADG